MSKNSKVIIITIIFSIVGVFLICCTVVGIMYVVRRNSANTYLQQQIIAPPDVIATPGTITSATPVPSISNQSQTVVGYIFNGGMYPELQASTGLPADTLQITNLEKTASTTGIAEIAEGFYLKGNIQDLAKYLGQCVSINGHVETGWEAGSSKISDSLNRSLFVVDRVYSSNACQDLYSMNTIEPTDMVGTFTGTVSIGQRPSPDINYDYLLLLDKPYKQIYDASGEGKSTNVLNIAPKDATTWKKLQAEYAKPTQKVKVTGFFTWGFAESQYFVIQTIEEV